MRWDGLRGKEPGRKLLQYHLKNKTVKKGEDSQLGVLSFQREKTFSERPPLYGGHTVCVMWETKIGCNGSAEPVTIPKKSL